jgi:hypothetical protein
MFKIKTFICLLMVVSLAPFASEVLAAEGVRLTQDDIMNAEEDRNTVLRRLDEQQKEFVVAYLAALANRNLEIKKQMLHPSTLQCLNKTGQLESLYAQRKNVILKKDSKIAFLKGSTYQQAGGFPIENLYTLAVSNAWCPEINARVTLVIPVIKEGDKYFEIVPCA